MVPMTVRDIQLKIKQCLCDQCTVQKNLIESAQTKLGIKPYYLPDKQCPNLCNGYNEKTVPLKHVMAERLTILLMQNKLPMYLFNCRLATLSKTKSLVIEKVGDIRPIGILSVLLKVVEKAIKLVMEKECNYIIDVGMEQAGFAKGRSTLDH